ncbi:GTP-binding protein [Nocardia yamanashiensis]|uniref:GTP-binding protein n=1 Tax=Nocardia yamanashiensis TaxID=209247 RepID=UPI001E54BFCF|nr:GTP-binding protein [Nocardia yamanashiensis]UGT45133.1 GTP-binding protein [Nocardia yamanashiensis]
MGIEAIDPQSIRNVTLAGDPAGIAPLADRLRGRADRTGAIRRTTDRIEHTIRIAELPGHLPAAALERAIRVAEGLIMVVDAAGPGSARLETLLHVADDHQVARLCLVTGLDRPTADFDRCVATVAAARGATALPLHSPIDPGPAFDGVIDLIPLGTLAAPAAEFYGPHWHLAQRRYRDLVGAVLDQRTAAGPPELEPERLRQRIRRLTRIGDIVPILCAPAPGDDLGSLLDAIARYLPSPLDVCQPEHALDY